MPRIERKLSAIMFTDIVGYTALMGRDEAAGRRVRARHDALVRPLVGRYGGRWVEEKGDESLSTFPSALDSVNCALAIQAALQGDAELSLPYEPLHDDPRYVELLNRIGLPQG